MNRRALRLATELVIAVAIIDEIPVSGAPPPADVPIVDGYHEDYPEQVFANNVAQRDAWLASDTFVAVVVAESNERLPINPVALSGTATSTSTATGTLSVTALITPEIEDANVPLVWQKPPPDTLYAPHIASLANDLPLAPVALSGSASATSTAAGTLSGSALYPEDIGPDFVLSQRPVDSSALLFAVANTEEIPVDGTVAEAPADVLTDELPPVTHAPILPLYVESEELPVSPVALSGSATATSGAIGNVVVSALPIEDPQSVAPAPMASAPPPPEELPVSPVAISGTASATSSATGTLSLAHAVPDELGPEYLLGQRPPDNSALLLAMANAEEIPVSGAIEVATEVLDDPTPIVGGAPAGQVPVQDEVLPVAPVALSGTATSTSSATGTISVSALVPEPDALPTPAPMAAAEADRTEPVFQPVALSGSAVSASTATGALSVGTLPLPEDGPLSAPQGASFDLVGHVAASDGLVESGAAVASVPADASGTNFAVYPTTGANHAAFEATGANAALYSALGANRAAFPTEGRNFEVAGAAGELEP